MKKGALQMDWTQLKFAMDGNGWGGNNTLCEYINYEGFCQINRFD